MHFLKIGKVWDYSFNSEGPKLEHHAHFFGLVTMQVEKSNTYSFQFFCPHPHTKGKFMDLQQSKSKKSMNMGSIHLCHKAFHLLHLHHMFKFHPFLKILLFSISNFKPITFNLKVDITYIMPKSMKMMQLVTILFQSQGHSLCIVFIFGLAMVRV